MKKKHSANFQLRTPAHLTKTCSGHVLVGQVSTSRQAFCRCVLTCTPTSSRLCLSNKSLSIGLLKPPSELPLVNASVTGHCRCYLSSCPATCRVVAGSSCYLSSSDPYSCKRASSTCRCQHSCLHKSIADRVKSRAKCWFGLGYHGFWSRLF